MVAYEAAAQSCSCSGSCSSSENEKLAILAVYWVSVPLLYCCRLQWWLATLGRLVRLRCSSFPVHPPSRACALLFLSAPVPWSSSSLLLQPGPVTALPAAGPVPLEAVLIKLRARREGADHDAAGPDRLIEQLIEAVVRNGDLELAVRQLRQVGVVLHQLGALDQVLVNLQLLGQVVDHILLAGIGSEFAHLHPAAIVADNLQPIRVAVVANDNKVVLLRMLLAVETAPGATRPKAGTHATRTGTQSLQRLVAELEVLLVHPALDLVDAVAHLVHLLLDGLQFGGESARRLIFALVAVERDHRVFLDGFEHRVIDVDARAVEAPAALLAAASNARGGCLLGDDRFLALWAVFGHD
ncbi:hypothetical protein KR200_002467 [Drosophila serrata]|nr:hypothetical protein KR200_002467 [Drosophila serrata]